MHKCPNCGEEFDTKQEFVKHLKANKKCQVCAIMELVRKTTSDMKIIEELFDEE